MHSHEDGGSGRKCAEHGTGIFTTKVANVLILTNETVRNIVQHHGNAILNSKAK